MDFQTVEGGPPVCAVLDDFVQILAEFSENPVKTYPSNLPRLERNHFFLTMGAGGSSPGRVADREAVG